MEEKEDGMKVAGNSEERGKERKKGLDRIQKDKSRRPVVEVV